MTCTKINETLPIILRNELSSDYPCPNKDLNV